MSKLASKRRQKAGPVTSTQVSDDNAGSSDLSSRNDDNKDECLSREERIFQRQLESAIEMSKKATLESSSGSDLSQEQAIKVVLKRKSVEENYSVTPPRRAKARKLILSDDDSDDEFVGFEAKKPTKKVPEKTQKTKPTTTRKENQPKTVDLASGGETKILERVDTKYKSDKNDLENEYPPEENITEIEKFINETNKNPSSTRDLKDFSSICDLDFAPKTSMAGLPSIIPSMPLKENKAKVIPNYIKKAMEKRGIDIEKTYKTPESIKEVSSKETNVKSENKAGKGDNKDEPSTSTSRPSRQRRKLIVSDDSNSENSSDEDDDFGKKSTTKTVPQPKKPFVTPVQSKKPTDTPVLSKKQAAILHLAHITPKPAQQQSKNKPETPKLPDAAASPILGVAKPKLISMPKWTPPARVGQKSRDSVSPSGLSNLSPGFRVGLSRHGKFKPLHPNVKMAP